MIMIVGHLEIFFFLVFCLSVINFDENIKKETKIGSWKGKEKKFEFFYTNTHTNGC